MWAVAMLVAVGDMARVGSGFRGSRRGADVARSRGGSESRLLPEVLAAIRGLVMKGR